MGIYLINECGTPLSNYEKIILENLKRAFNQPLEYLLGALPAKGNNSALLLRAFGHDCSLEPDRITFSGESDSGPRGLLVSLYAASAVPEQIKLEPFKSFKDLPNSMPYHGAFAANSEQILVPHVSRIKDKTEGMLSAFQGGRSRDVAGDLALLLYPLPKIALLYIFYLADDDFPASATCLFSSNGLSFMPLDGLADVAEYTSKEIIGMLNQSE